MEPVDSASITQTIINVKEADNNRLNNEEKTTLSKDAVTEDKVSAENSEYDSADSYTDEEPDVKIRSRASDQDDHSHSDTGGSITLEREEGDGQESIPNRKVDDDEDKKNPQYIPKRGTFYEHDDRTAEEPETAEPADAEKDKEGKKKVWQDKKERWSHDRFNDSEQAPKSRSELIAIYGYDIRNEDGPPRARRRRRYGRGPNKYTRNWEDEDAYNKPPPARPKKPVRPKIKAEEFPPLGKQISKMPEEALPQYENDQREEPERMNRKSVERNEPIKTEKVFPQAPPPVDLPVNINGTNQETSTIKNIHQRIGSGRVAKPNKEIKDSDYRGFTTKTRQQRTIKTEQQKVLPARNQKKEDFIQTQNFTNKNSVQEVEKEMSKLSMDGGHKTGKHNNHNNQRQGSMPPRLQAEQKGSKRYSSIRQRSLPEANTPPVPNYQHTSFYPNDYSQQSTAAAPQPQILHQNPQIHPASPQVPQLPPPTLPPIPQQVPVTAAPLLQAQFPQAFPQAPPAFLQPGVAPPTFIQPPAPQIINYVQGQPPFNPNYQGFQQQFNPVTQPAELYQPQGGITYYSTDQQVAQRPVPQKRPKAAIPIVAPPSNEKKEESSPAYSQSDSVVDRGEYKEDVDVQQ